MSRPFWKGRERKMRREREKWEEWRGWHLKQYYRAPQWLVFSLNRLCYRCFGSTH
jgi:hypothetical protein